MTIPTAPHSDTSNLPTTDIFGGRNPRLVTDPWREIAALALLGANAVFQFLGFTGLFFVIDGWATGFGIRAAAAYGVFVAGLVPVGFPILAVLLATHVRPIVTRARLITLLAVIQYGVSGVLGVITFLGAFANDLDSVRATLVGVLYRVAWAGLLALAGTVVLRLWLGLFHVPKPRAVAYPQYAPSYGQPYPGQPMYPDPTYVTGRVGPTYAGAPANNVGSPAAPRSGGPEGWPSVPPPPMPQPVAEFDLTQRLPPPPPPASDGPAAGPAGTTAGPTEENPVVTTADTPNSTNSSTVTPSTVTPSTVTPGTVNPSSADSASSDGPSPNGASPDSARSPEPPTRPLR